jgi:MoxR-like ATPase
VLPDDLQALAVPVLAHRIIPTAESQLARRTTDAIVADLITRLPLPTDRPRSPYDTRQRPAASSANPYDPRRR